MESNPPVIQSFTRHVAKDTAFAAEYEDAFHVALEQGRAAIADGVSSAIFSGRWARILARKVVEDPPDLSEPDGWVKWLADPRRLWLEDIDFPRMPQHQKTKLRQVGGAYCTLCWVEFHTLPDSEAGVRRCGLRAYAMGDSCLLLIRSGRLVTSFPLAKADDFDLDPDSVCSVATSRDGQQSLAATDIECLDGDVIVLVTDAIGKWMLDSVENGRPTPWEQLWTLDEGDWAVAIEQLREANTMKRDDTTMVVLQVGDGPAAWSQPKPVGIDQADLLLNDVSDTVNDADGLSAAVINDVDANAAMNQGAELHVVFAVGDADDSVPADGNLSGIHQVDDCVTEYPSEPPLELANSEDGETAAAGSDTASTSGDENRETIVA